MNYSMIFFIIGWVFIIEAALMAPSALVALLYSERSILAFAAAIGLCLLLGVPLVRKQPANKVFYAKEGCVTVALSWIVMSLMGALPFVFSGVIPSIVDAMFETVSGFTTTGASILKDVEVLPRLHAVLEVLYHLDGGMGVLVSCYASGHVRRRLFHEPDEGGESGTIGQQAGPQGAVHSQAPVRPLCGPVSSGAGRCCCWGACRCLTLCVPPSVRRNRRLRNKKQQHRRIFRLYTVRCDDLYDPVRHKL